MIIKLQLSIRVYKNIKYVIKLLKKLIILYSNYFYINFIIKLFYFLIKNFYENNIVFIKKKYNLNKNINKNH
jgi:hypothetical protein